MLLCGDSNSAGWNPKLDGGDQKEGVIGFERSGSLDFGVLARLWLLWYPPNISYRCFFSFPSDCNSNGPLTIFPFTLRATDAMLPLPLGLRSRFGGGDRNLLSFGGGAGGGIGVSICALILCFFRRR